MILTVLKSRWFCLLASTVFVSVACAATLGDPPSRVEIVNRPQEITKALGNLPFDKIFSVEWRQDCAPKTVWKLCRRDAIDCMTMAFDVPGSFRLKVGIRTIAELRRHRLWIIREMPR